MDSLSNIAFPSLSSQEFKDFWSFGWGFAVVVAIIGGALSFFVYAKTKNMVSLLNAAITVVGTFVLGWILPPALYLGTWLSKEITSFLVTLPSLVAGTPVNPWNQVMAGVISALNGSLASNQGIATLLSGVLEWMVGSIIGLLYFFAFLTLISYPVRQIGFGFTIYRIGFAGMVTAVFLPSLVIFVLSIGAVAIKVTGTDVGNLNSTLAFILFFACLLPIALFVFLFRRMQKIQIEGPVAVSGGSVGGFFRGASIGMPVERGYVGKIPETGDTMESVANKANWVSSKLAIASKALAVTVPQAAPAVAGVAATLGAAGAVAEQKAGSQKDAASEKAPDDTSLDVDSGITPNATPATSVPAVVGSAAAGVAIGAQAASSAPSVASSSGVTETPDVGPAKPTRRQAIRQGTSSAAEGASKVADSVAKAAQWTSGAQRKAQKGIETALRR